MFGTSGMGIPAARTRTSFAFSCDYANSITLFYVIEQCSGGSVTLAGAALAEKFKVDMPSHMIVEYLLVLMPYFSVGTKTNLLTIITSTNGGFLQAIFYIVKVVQPIL